jgi:O-antigen biosynthesis protein
VPKAAFELRLVDVEGRPWLDHGLSITSLRAVSLVELAVRAFFKFPRKIAAVLALWRAGNHRGVAFRFARLADEINAMPYARWLARHREALPAPIAGPDGATVLVTLDDPASADRALASLKTQNGRHAWRLVSRDELHAARLAADTDILAKTSATGMFWLNIPAGVILAEDAMQRLLGPFSSPDVAAAYCDEDRITRGGRHSTPFLKPAWSPLMAKSGWLPLDCAMLRLAALPAAFDVRTGTMADAVVAAADERQTVVHLPQILMSRPLSRRRDAAPIRAVWQGAARPGVTVIIPTRDRLDLMKTCIEGLKSRTEGVELDIVIIDNDSREEATIAYFATLERQARARIIPMAGQFNFSRACNLGVEAARHDLILLMNNDVDPITPDWLLQMSAELQDDTVGAVGAYLFYPDGTVQHAGVALGAGSVARHSLAFVRPGSGEDRGLLDERRDVSAVTAACLLTRRSLWRDVGGMDEENLTVAFNDVDYCLKLRDAGHRIIWTPDARLWHRESVSRGKDDTAEKLKRFAHEEATLMRRWGAMLANDPFHNPNLSRVAEDFVLETFPGNLAPRTPDRSW